MQWEDSWWSSSSEQNDDADHDKSHRLSCGRIHIPIRLHPEPQYPPASSPPENLEMTSRRPAPRTTTASGVRRNLFSHSLSRRPTTSSTSGTSATTLQVVSEEANADIVARDEHGNYLLEQPTMTPMPRNELQEERGGFIYMLNLQWLLTNCG